MSTFAQNLRALMEKHGVSQNELARSAGLTQSAINKILTGKTKQPGIDTTEAIARVLNVSVAQLIYTPDLPKDADPVAGFRRVPLISWVQAGLPTPVSSLDDLDKWYICPVSISNEGFALKVRGESMEPMFYEGDIVFIDPEIPAESGRIVAAVDDGAADPEATLKKLVKDGPDYYLKALNPDWPGPKFQPFTQSMRIAGVAVGKYVEL